jgi:hypothetical protein
MAIAVQGFPRYTSRVTRSASCALLFLCLLLPAVLPPMPILPGSTLAPVLTGAEAISLALEVGANDYRISDMGGNWTTGAADPAVAYNSTGNEYLVVWQGDENGDYGAGPLADDEFEIYGQRIDAATGAEVGANDFRISDMGPDGDADYDALNPAVAYNSQDDEYLVVWEGDDDTDFGDGPLADDEFEIFGQRINAATGDEEGTDFRISETGPDGLAFFKAHDPAVAYNPSANRYVVVWSSDINDLFPSDQGYEIRGQHLTSAGLAHGWPFFVSDMGNDWHRGGYDPAVAYNSVEDEFLVVWYGDDDAVGLADDEWEIFGQRIDTATGAPLGTNDFRISDMGGTGDTTYRAYSPAVAYNSTDSQYLVVWTGDDNTDFGDGPLADEELEIWGQRIHGDLSLGDEIDADFRISDMGPDGKPLYFASRPDVAYNGKNNEYLVVWTGLDDLGVPGNQEIEAFGQRIDAATGAEVGENDFRISDMGPEGHTGYTAYQAAVAYNSTNKQYLVIWQGDDDQGDLVQGEEEVFGQRLRATTGAEVGADDFRISDVGGDLEFDAGYPAVAYNRQDNLYLVVWEGDDNTDFGQGPLAADETEIYGQLIDAATGAEVGVDDFRISDMGPDGQEKYDAERPAVAYNSQQNEFLVVWRGDDDTDFGNGPLEDDEFEIFGQRLDAETGAEIETDFRISDMGPDGDNKYRAYTPAVAYNRAGKEYLVVWQGDDNTDFGLGLLADDEREIFGQLVQAATGAEIGGDFRISQMGPDGSAEFNAYSPAVVWNNDKNEYLVVWEGDDDNLPLVDEEREIFGRLVSGGTGALPGDKFRVSDMGPNGDKNYSAGGASVAYASREKEYLVTWSGCDVVCSVGPPNDFEVFGQRLDADAGEIGADFRISDMGPEGDVHYDAFAPATAYNAARSEYLVAWSGCDTVYGPGDDPELEIYAQRLDAATGEAIGDDNFRLSNMGPEADFDYDALSPAVAGNGAGNEYLVVWHGDDDRPPLVNDEYEIFAQRYQLEQVFFRIYVPLVLK